MMIECEVIYHKLFKFSEILHPVFYNLLVINNYAGKNLMKLGFYRSLLVGFTVSWIIPDSWYNEMMIKWHEMKE